MTLGFRICVYVFDYVMYLHPVLDNREFLVTSDGNVIKLLILYLIGYYVSHRIFSVSYSRVCCIFRDVGLLDLYLPIVCYGTLGLDCLVLMAQYLLESLRSIFSTLPNIYYRGFTKNSLRLKYINYFRKQALS